MDMFIITNNKDHNNWKKNQNNNNIIKVQHNKKHRDSVPLQLGIFTIRYKIYWGEYVSSPEKN